MRDSFLELIPDIVDSVVFEMLNACDNEELPIEWVETSGRRISMDELTHSGESAGWYIGDDGWRNRYSSEPSSSWVLED